MKKQILLFAAFIFVFASIAPAQKRTVTNADLEKFRQKRVQAEEDYRQNYQRLGLPSPEEIEQQRVQNQRDLADLSARLQIENQARERRQREDEYQRAQLFYLRSIQSNQSYGYGGGANYYPYGYGGYGYGGYGASYGYGYPNYYGNGYYNKYYNRYGNRGGFARGGFYDTIIPGAVAPPRQGVRINTGSGVRIGITTGGGFGGFHGSFGSPH